MKVGIVGCGVISKHYAENAGAFDAFEIVACADLEAPFAEATGHAQTSPPVERACNPARARPWRS